MTTEKSADDAVLDDVFSSSRDRGGNDAPPAVSEAKVQPETVAEPPKGKEPATEATEQPAEQPSDTEPKGYRDPSTGRFVPLKELTTEREKRQAAEKAREEEARLRKESDERWERRLQEIERNQRQAQNPPQPQQPPPDPNLDPAGALAFQQQSFQQAMLNQRLNMSERFARMEHGKEAVDAALKRAVDAGVLTQNWVYGSPDFYADLMQWDKQQQVLQRVGTDPVAYEKSIEERVRAQVLEELKSGNRAVMPGQMPAPAAPQQHFPGSLADATASGASGAAPQNDEAMMGSVFASGRKRK